MAKPKIRKIPSSGIVRVRGDLGSVKVLKIHATKIDNNGNKFPAQYTLQSGEKFMDAFSFKSKEGVITIYVIGQTQDQTKPSARKMKRRKRRR